MGLNNLLFLAAQTESLGDIMARAGLNTAMGILIVFFTLAFIAIIIWLEGKIFTSIDKRKAAPKTIEAPAPVETEAYAEADLSDDEELVAVITAAIYAFEAEAGEYVPADGLVVKSIIRRR